MALARDIMTPSPQCVGEDQTLSEAARLLASLDIGVLPICGDDQKLIGMLTDRDIVVKALAEGLDPTTTTAGSLAAGKPVYVQAADDVQQAMDLMKEHQVRRIPVIEDHRLVGIISQADIALTAPAKQTGRTVEQISE
ncbi:CBS domain-containing protein [Microbacterium sp. 4R-513]|uniref:CBS domain-containing protein n=1 Tax=Microbacterium sp. 4R-513 TaxID=2567934 RepID=UPI0013E1376C|nr:CBS domain-containing protein [Microbacterium sp. 4R-513]QIG39871.1 CBS domain-containing protein [Microbacterium sp. 4R-513]